MADNDDGQDEVLSLGQEPAAEADMEPVVEPVIAPTAEKPVAEEQPVAAEPIDLMTVPELGDRIVIDSERYGRTVGRIYFRSADLIRILPDGVSDRLYDFSRTPEDQFTEDLGVSASYIVVKRQFPQFVKQQDLRAGQTIQALTSQGTVLSTRTVTEVDEEDDTITTLDEAGDQQVIDFAYEGIPLEEPFQIIRAIKAPPEAEAEAEAEAETAAPIPVPADEDTLEEPEIVVLGQVELPKVAIYREAVSADKVYSDAVQKTDALNDFLNMLDPRAQRDSKSIRAVRILVETLFAMKLDLISYNPDGSIKGINPLSVNTVGQLLDTAPVPLGRAVLSIAKRIYMSPEDDALGVPPPTERAEDYYISSFLQELETMNRISTASTGTGGHYLREQEFAEVQRPWRPNAVTAPRLQARTDTDAFRGEIPDLDTATVEGGFLPSYNASQDKNYPTIANITHSIERVLSATYKKGAGAGAGEARGKKQTLIPAEQAKMKSYLLFPTEKADALGTIRSGSLALDSGRAAQHKETMRTIIAELGGIEEVTTAKGILALGAAGNTLGNIPLKDYIEGVQIIALGIGDTATTLADLGLNNLEMTPELFETLQSKIKSYQNQLLVTLSALRKALTDVNASDTYQIDLKFLDDPSILSTLIQTEPILVEDLRDFRFTNSHLADSDLATAAYLLRKHADYFMVAAGQQAAYTARERLRAVRDVFIHSLQVAKLLKQKATDKGLVPVPNKCQHTAELRTIRKIPDQQEQYTVLTKFFAKYQGTREDNWINCNICKQNLICVHERLQIQAFLSPREKDQIQKEIILNFADGVFNGSFICRNCGQPMQELAYDTHIEYDDEGRPMMGRAVLVDREELRREEVEMALGAPVGTSTEFDFGSEAENFYYRVTKEIAERVGVNLPRDAYLKILPRVAQFIGKLPDRKAYAAIQKQKKGAMADYDVIIARNTVIACTVFLLIEIQTHIPDYVVRYAIPGCVASFAGHPLGAEADRRGIIYMACAVSSITRNDSPWNTSGFQSERSDKKRQELVQRYIESVMRDVLKDDPTLQQAIQDKRAYLQETFGQDGTEGRPGDIIPSEFLPAQLRISPDEPIIPEVIGATATAEAAAASMASRVWLIQGHLLAKKTASLVRGSPYLDTTCCLASIERPGQFWQAVTDLPKLSERRIEPILGARSSLKVRFEPRPQETLLVETPADLTYRLFLKVCYTGPRKGLPHEPGLTNICSWCGFQFPGHPKAIDFTNEGKTALLSQQVDTAKEEYQALLDDVHRRFSVEGYKAPTVTSYERVVEDLTAMSPAPTDDWVQLMTEMTAALGVLPRDANRGDLATALGSVSDAGAAARERVVRRVNEKARDALDQVGDLQWNNFFEVLVAYFITPFQRIATGFGPNAFVPRELKLADEHIADINKIFDTDQQVVKYFIERVAKSDFAKSKLRYYLRQMGQILKFQNKIRVGTFPGRDSTLKYLQRILFFGPIATLIDPSPPEDDMTEFAAARAVVDDGAKLLLNLVVVSAGKAIKERLAYDDEQLKTLIATRNEKEKVNIIQYFDKMTDEERAAELLMKRLGMGRWAVGGTAAIRVYDKDQYEREKTERAQAGILDFPGAGPTDVLGIEGRPFDELGLPGEAFPFDAYERDGGYDHVQTREDDA